MHYLIDGYNLLHALGILGPGRGGRITLDLARRQLLAMVHKAHRQEPGNVTVVFDAAQGRKRPAETSYQGVQVAFAVNHAQADDLIELMIRRAAHPHQLTVISNDHRIQQAAQRKDCVVMDCGRYMDHLAGAHAPERPIPETDASKPDTLSDEEHAHWLREFGGLDKDPALRELSEPWEFLDES